MIYMVRLFAQKSWLAGLVALLVTVACGVSARAADNPAQTQLPAAVVVQPSHDFGSVLEGTEIKHDFIVENHGSAVLEIQKVKPD